MAGVFEVGADGSLIGKGTAAPPPAVQTIFGYNTRSTAGTAYQTLPGRLAAFNNRCPILRWFPANANQMPAAFEVTATDAPEKRVTYSFKAGGSTWTEAQYASGAATSYMTTWLNSIPANWTVYWVHHHEPNDEFNAGTLDPALFVQVYHQMRLALNAASLHAGVQVFIGPIFLAFQISSASTWSDAWVPPRSDADFQFWDLYGNPGNVTSTTGSNQYGGPATGTAYGTTYPPVAARCADMYSIIDRTGFADSWGFGEMNSPGRDWDVTSAAGGTSPSNESGRVLWFRDMIQTALSPPMTGSVPPRVCTFWENTPIASARWDQSYGRVTGSTAAMTAFWYPYINGSP